MAFQTVYRWLAGSRVPSLVHAETLIKLSAGQVTVHDLVEHGKEVRGNGTGRRA